MNEKVGIETRDLKSTGFLKQVQPNLYSVRLRIPAGDLTASQSTGIAAASERFGTGDIHITTRQSIEIRNIPFDNLDDLVATLSGVDLHPGSCGARIRNVMACGGKRYCQNGISDSAGLAYAIDEHFFAKELPAKLKIAVSGCPNSCVKPQENDIGFVARVRPELDRDKCSECGLCIELCEYDAIALTDNGPSIDYSKCTFDGVCIQTCPQKAWSGLPGYAVIVGGKIGRKPQLGTEVLGFVPEVEEETILRLIDRVIEFFENNARQRERLGTLLNRIGIEALKEEISTIDL